MLKEGLNTGLSVDQLNADQTKYMFRFDINLSEYGVTDISNTAEELENSYNTQAERVGIPFKITKVLSMRDDKDNGPVIRVETTKPMTPAQFADIYQEVYDDLYTLVVDEGIYVVKICE